MIQSRYRQDYDGEFILLSTIYRNGIKEQNREWVPNPIVNQHVSGRAAVIGSNVDLKQFDYARLERHRGGLLGKKRFQTYGTNGTWDRMRFDFYVTKNREQAAKIKDHQYDEKAIVYTTTRLCIEHPGAFYIVPHNPDLCELAVAPYLAAFDGHDEIFLLGYNQEIGWDISSSWTNDVDQVIKTYQTATFYLIGVESNMPVQWRHNRNVRCMNYREFVTYCDV